MDSDVVEQLTARAEQAEAKVRELSDDLALEEN